MFKKHIILCIVVIMATAAGAQATKIKAKITSVSGKKVTIEISGDVLPVDGDEVTIAGTVPGLGEVPLSGTWKVTSVDDKVVTADTEDENAGTPQPGYIATISCTIPTAPEIPAVETPEQAQEQPAQQPDEPEEEEGQEPTEEDSTEQVEPSDVKLVSVLELSKASEVWAQEWFVLSTFKDFPNGGKAGFYNTSGKNGDASPAKGREGILHVHPETLEKPAKLARRVKLPEAEKQSILRLGVCANADPEGSWLLAVSAQGKQIGKDMKIEGKKGWQDLTFDLAAYAGKTVLLEIEAKAAQWWHQYAFFDYIEVGPEQTLAEETEKSTIRYTRPSLGLKIAEHTGAGLAVAEVKPDSPAANAGIAANDVILEFAGRDLSRNGREPQDLVRAVLDAPADKPVKVVYQHGANKRTIYVMLDRKPFFGVAFAAHTEPGFLVHEVVGDSPAAEAGIRKGDIITAYGDAVFGRVGIPASALVSRVAQSPLDKPVKVQLRRNGLGKTVYVAYSNKAQAAITAMSKPRDKPAESATPPSKPTLDLFGVKPSGSSTHAQVVFEDTFDSENKGRGQLNHRGFRQWYVGPGEVDLIGNGFMDYQPGNGLYVEMDGSKSLWSKARPQAGTLRMKQPLALEKGVYILSFALAGHPSQGPNTVVVQLTGLFQEEFTMEAQAVNTGFQVFSRKIAVPKASEARLIIQHQGGDWSGLLLDNIKLERISD